MTLVPALLWLVPHKGRVEAKRAWLSGLFSHARSRAWVDRLVRRRRGILAVSGALFVVSAVGLWMLRLNSDFRSMFPDSNKTIVDYNWIEGELGGLGDVELDREREP